MSTINYSKKILVTCGLPYANGKAHLGHMRTYVPADIFVRSLKKLNKDVIFICGSDVHGTPISINAEKQNIDPKDFFLKYHNHFKSLFKKMNIIFDIYGTTDDKENHKNTIDIINKNKDHIYKKKVSVPYCSVCKRYLPDRYLEGTCKFCGSLARGDECDQGCGKPLEPGDLINPICSICKNPTQYKMQDHYYFKLSDFKSNLKNFLNNLSGTENAINYSKKWLLSGLKDWCITRDLDWGIKYPNSSDLVVYVWVDAPIGYISFTEQLSKIKKFNINEYWKNNNAEIIHFIGGDIIYHHCIFWPSLLMGSNYSTPNCIIASGMLKINENKFSKSRGYVVWVEEDYLDMGYDADMLRYYLVSSTSHTKELNFSWKSFQEKINLELINIFCNFIYRTLYFIKTYCSDLKRENVSNDIYLKIKETIEKSKENLMKYDFKKYVDIVMELSSFGNSYIQLNEPWKIYNIDIKKCSIILINSLQIVKALCILFDPILPKKMQEVWEMIGYNTKLKDIPFDNALISVFDDCIINIKNLKILFDKISDEKIKMSESILSKRMEKAIKINTNTLTNNKLKEENSMNTKEIVTIDDFQKFNIVVGKIKTIESIKNSTKLYKLLVDIGDIELRQIVSGIKQYYQPEELINKNVCVITNLKPIVLCGVESRGMILASQDKENNNVKVIIMDDNINVGSIIC